MEKYYIVQSVYMAGYKRKKIVTHLRILKSNNLTFDRAAEKERKERMKRAMEEVYAQM